MVYGLGFELFGFVCSFGLFVYDVLLFANVYVLHLIVFIMVACCLLCYLVVFVLFCCILMFNC